MPGTIQVSILELVGLPSVSQSSSMGIKVTMGKQALEAQDTGDFSFPLASLRDNLNVSVHDSEGNEVANTAVETRAIVEKGTWDDLFALKGGGHVRMRLRFVLTEDELNKIRSMRESVTRKKRDDLLKRSRSSSELPFASGGSTASSQDSLKATTRQAEKQYANTKARKVSVGSDAEILSKGFPVQKRQTTPASTSSKSSGALEIKEVIEGQDEEKQSPLDKAPSSVRKMALAFETKPVKEVSIAVYKTRPEPEISSTAVKLPSLKRDIGANAKPAPIPESAAPVKESGRNEDAREELLVQKPKDSKKLQTIDYIPSKKDIPEMQSTREGQKEEIPEMQPTREELKEEKKDLKLQNIDYLSSNKDIPLMQPTRGDQKEERKDLKLINIDRISSIPKIQPNREEEQGDIPNREEQNIYYQSSNKDTPMPKMQPAIEDQKEDLPKLQTTREEKKEEKRDLKLQTIDCLSSKKNIPKMQPNREEQKVYIPKMQPVREEQKEEKNDLKLKLQKMDHLSSKKDIHKMQPTREEQKVDTPEVQPARDDEQKDEKKDLTLQTIDCLSTKKDIPKMQPTREEQKVDTPEVQPARDNEHKDEKKDLKVQTIDCLSRKKDIPKMQSTREDQKVDTAEVQPARDDEQKDMKIDLKLQTIGCLSSKKDTPKMQPTREDQKVDTLEMQPARGEQKDLKLQTADCLPSKKDKPKRQTTREDKNEQIKSPKTLHRSSSTDSRFSWGGLVRAFPSKNHSSADPFVIEKNWRSKHWASLRHRVKSNMSYENVNLASDRIHDWTFLDEMICSCIQNDDRPFLDLLEGCLSNCSSETSQGKLTDSGVAPNRDEKSSIQPKKFDPHSSTPKNGDSRRPIGQAMKIVIMVGFGVLVFLTRQRR